MEVCRVEEPLVTLVDLAQPGVLRQAGQDVVLGPLQSLEEDFDLGPQPLEVRRSLEARGISACNWEPPW